jgi:leader peptidase (prepilin peptidase)/N-methyltransferase
VQAVPYVFSVLFGLVIGSFLNVVIYRLPRHESLVRPGSHCPACGRAIRWYDNVPVVSWLLLMGKCRDCKGGISLRYPLVEGFTAASFGLVLWRFGLSWPLPVSWFFVAALIAIALIDYDHMIIPSTITLPGAALGVATSIALQPQRWWVYLAAAFGGALFCFLLAMLWPGGGMGGGDVTMALFAGAFLGAKVLVGFFLAFLLGSMVGVYILLVLKRSRKTKVPFGPFLAVGCYVSLFAGSTILDAYMSLWR